jgi:flagellar basal body L-ring protein FlgH
MTAPGDRRAAQRQPRVEAQRKIFMNNQHEDMTIRGVVRPNDIGPSNTVPFHRAEQS